MVEHVDRVGRASPSRCRLLQGWHLTLLIPGQVPQLGDMTLWRDKTGSQESGSTQLLTAESSVPWCVSQVCKWSCGSLGLSQEGSHVVCCAN